MHDMPSVTLLQQENATPRTGQELEVLGKCAAKKYVDGTCSSLNDAVVETVKQAGLSPEQVRRVIEFANTDAYLVEFNKEGAQSRYVEFHGGPASPAEVLRDLNDGGGGTVFDRGLSDYSLEPTMPKTAALMERNLSVVHDALQAYDGLEKAARYSFGQPTMRDIGGDMQGDAMKAYSFPGYGSMGFDPFGEQQKRMQVRMLSAAIGRKPVVVKHASLDVGLGTPSLGDEARGLLQGEPTGSEMASSAPLEEDPNAAPQETPSAAPGDYDPLPEHMKLMQQHLKLMQQRSGGVVGGQKVAALDFHPVETALRDAFHVEEQPYDFANPLQDSMELRDKLAGAAEHLTAEVFGLENQLFECLEDVYRQVKTAALEGLELGQVLAAWQQVVPDSEYVKVAFSHIGPRLAEEEVFVSLDAVGASLEKTAHAGMVNLDHPLVGSMSAFCLSLDKVAEVRMVQDELIANREVLEEFLQKMSYMQGVKASGGLVKNVVRGAQQGGQVAGKGARELGEVLFGQGSGAAGTLGAVAENAVRYAPHAAAGGAGLLAVQEAKESPITHAVASRLPGTRANAMRRQQKMMMQGGY